VKSLCRRPPIAAQPRRDIGVTGWACTSYSGVTARGLSTSPSATSLVPHESSVAYGNDSVDSHSLAAFIDNFTVGTAGWTRTTFSPLKRRDSRPLSYDGMGWCSVLESNQAGPVDARVTASPGSVPV
jgi:hypothetical protein